MEQFKLAFKKSIRTIWVRLFDNMCKSRSGIPHIDVDHLSHRCQADGIKFKEVLKSIRINKPSVQNTIEKNICDRRTNRIFSLKPVEKSQLLKLLAFGVGLPDGKQYPNRRNYPSAGALYPLDFFIINFNIKEMPYGIYYFNQHKHLLEQIWDSGLNESLKKHLEQGNNITNSSFAIVICASIYKTILKYGNRGYRYVMIEAGHVMQNFYLLSSEYGIGIVPLGGYDENILNKALRLNKELETTVYIALGGKVDD